MALTVRRRTLLGYVMELAYMDGRPISAVTDIQTERTIAHAPIEFSARVSEQGASLLNGERAPFYRGRDGESRFTLTIDSVTGVTIAGTIRRR